MNELRERFIKSSDKHPEWGAYLHICVTVKKKKLSKEIILKLFNELMPVDEFDKPERSELVDYLKKITL